MIPEEAVLCSHYAQLCIALPLTQGLGQANWKLANPSTSEDLSQCIMQFLDNYNYFGYLKGANEVNRQYFQQALLLWLLKALYYAGICSYATCIIL